VVFEMPGTTLEIRKLHCRGTCPIVDERMKQENCKNKKHMGRANTNVLPMQMFGGMEQSGHGGMCMADACGFICWIFDTEGMRVEVV